MISNRVERHLIAGVPQQAGDVLDALVIALRTGGAGARVKRIIIGVGDLLERRLMLAHTLERHAPQELLVGVVARASRTPGSAPMPRRAAPPLPTAPQPRPKTAATEPVSAPPTDDQTLILPLVLADADSCRAAVVSDDQAPTHLWAPETTAGIADLRLGGSAADLGHRSTLRSLRMKRRTRPRDPRLLSSGGSVRQTFPSRSIDPLSLRTSSGREPQGAFVTRRGECRAPDHAFATHGHDRRGAQRQRSRRPGRHQPERKQERLTNSAGWPRTAAPAHRSR